MTEKVSSVTRLTRYSIDAQLPTIVDDKYE